MAKPSTERRYYLSILPLEVECFAKAVRSHWGVENQLHWVMEVVFNEDQSRARQRPAAENLALLRRCSLNLIKADQRLAKRSLKARRKNAGWDNHYLLHLLGINLDA
jgi:predicted transposase YbfD/YdcC